MDFEQLSYVLRYQRVATEALVDGLPGQLLPPVALRPANREIGSVGNGGFVRYNVDLRPV